MAKTGFSNGFADVATKKYYKYHGWVRSCNTEPILPPNTEYPTEKPIVGPKWVLIYDDHPPTADSWIRNFDYLLFPPAEYYDNCYFKFPDRKKRFYFYEIYFVFVPRYEGDFWSVHWDNGLNCAMDGETGITGHFYKSMWGLLEYGFPGEQYCIYLDPSGAGSRVKVWASETGELPGYNPVPIDERKW